MLGQPALSEYLFVNNVYTRKWEVSFSAGKQRAELSCLSIRLYFNCQAVSFGDPGGSSIVEVVQTV